MSPEEEKIQETSETPAEKAQVDFQVPSSSAVVDEVSVLTKMESALAALGFVLDRRGVWGTWR
jgi:hypothetical protein